MLIDTKFTSRQNADRFVIASAWSSSCYGVYRQVSSLSLDFCFILCWCCRLFTGNYKSNGNLVSLKLDIIDFTDFQRHGCLSGGGCSSQPHSHNITGTLYCHPDSNTVRLNLNLLAPPPPCNDGLKPSWPPATSCMSKYPAPSTMAQSSFQSSLVTALLA